MGYIRVEAVQNRLKEAEASWRPVILITTAGWGKTTAVEHYYEGRELLKLSCLEGKLDQMPELDSIREKNIFIDDISWLQDKESRRYVRDLLYMKDKHVVLAGRGRFPVWLELQDLDLDLMRITEKELVFTQENMEEFFRERNVELTAYQLKKLFNLTKGYPVAALFYRQHMENGERLSGKLETIIWETIFHYFDHTFYSLWREDMRVMLMSVSRYPSFTVEMARELSGLENVREILEYCLDIGSFIEPAERDGFLVLREELRLYLQWKQDIVWTKEEIRKNYYAAGTYYESMNMYPEALWTYQSAGAVQDMKRNLIKSAVQHPGTAHYYESAPYYMALSREEILSSPVLITGMSMIYSLRIEPDKSEEWYGELLRYIDRQKKNSDAWITAREWKAYLDLSLPHRAGEHLLELIRATWKLWGTGICVPELSITDHLPSLINGGLDLSEWTRDDRVVADLIRQPVETIFRSHARGLVDVALAESGFYKKSMRNYEMITLLNDGYEDASHGGAVEVAFASMATLARLYASDGKLDVAIRRVDAFCEKMENTKFEDGVETQRILVNLTAFRAWLGLYEGDVLRAEDYLKDAPDEHRDFWLLDRYRYSIKLKCLIERNRLDEALDLASFQSSYFRSYQRTIYEVENELMKAIILYRQKEEGWREILEKQLAKAAEYHYVRLISMEGSAILPLLKELAPLYEKADGSRDPEFFQEVLAETKRMAAHYPSYLEWAPEPDIQLSSREKEIFGYIVEGRSMQEICDICGITYSGVKKHNRSIYRKLGVKNRVEAERKAAQMGFNS